LALLLRAELRFLDPALALAPASAPGDAAGRCPDAAPGSARCWADAVAGGCPAASGAGEALRGPRCLFLPPDRGPRPLAGGVVSAMMQIRLCFPAGIGAGRVLATIVAAWRPRGKVAPRKRLARLCKARKLG